MKLYKHSYRNGTMKITEIDARETKELYISENSATFYCFGKNRLNLLVSVNGYLMISKEPNAELFKSLIVKYKAEIIADQEQKIRELEEEINQVKNCEVLYA